MDLATALRSKGIEVAEPGDSHYRTGWVNVPCPFCMGTSKHLGIKTDMSRANCYKCGGKSVVRVLRVLLNWNKEQTAEFEKTRLQNPETWVQRVTDLGTYKPPKTYDSLVAADREFLLRRRFSETKIDAMEYLYGLRSVHPYSGYPMGVFIPICTDAGVPVSWTIRYRCPIEGQRYHTAKNEQKSMHEKHLLGNEHLLKQRGYNSIIVVEGPFDSMAIGPGACHTFGLAYSPQQLWRISRYPRRYILFDKGTSAQNVARRLALDLSVFPGQTEQIELDADDPGSAAPQEIQQLREYVGL